MIEMRKSLVILGMATLLLLTATLALPAAAESNVCRDLPSGDQAADTPISVTLDVTVDGAGWYLIDETIPAGLTVVNAGGASTTTPGHLKWSVSAGATDTTYTYTVKGSAGSYTFSGEYNMQGMSTVLPIDCDTGLVISTGFCLTLDAGWNMVSIPKKIDSSSSNAAPDVFNLVGGESCDYYNGCTGEWSSNWDVNVVPCRGYFVYKLAPETICVDLDTGTGTPPSQYLCAGWNLVGHIDTSERSVEEFASMTTLGDTIAQMWHRTSDGTWTGYQYWGLTTVTPGDGYWLLMSEDGWMYGTP